MNQVERDALVQQLGQAMSDLSEECYYAGWLGGTEYFVPELCRRAAASDRPQPWGHGVVTPAVARELLALAARVGAWADLHPHEDRYVPHHPFPVPPEYTAVLDRELEFERARSRPR